MDSFIYRLSLDMHDTSSQSMLNIKKNDSKRQFIFNLTDGGKPYTIRSDSTAVFRAVKPDKTVLYNNCTISGNTIIYNLTDQTSSSVGIVECELTLYAANGEQITSPRFTLRVDNTLYSDSEVESRSEFTELSKAIAETRNLNVSVSKSNGVTTITVTDKNGDSHSETIFDGQKGETGPMGPQGPAGEGVPVVTASDVGKFARVNSQGKWVAEEVPNANGVNF